MARETENYMAGLDPYEPITDADEGWGEPVDLIWGLAELGVIVLAVAGVIFYFAG